MYLYWKTHFCAYSEVKTFNLARLFVYIITLNIECMIFNCLVFLRIKDNPELRKVAMKILAPTSDDVDGSAESDTHNDNIIKGLGISPV